MKKFFAEFKQFISRGNILDLAVGVIIGGAFSAIVTAFTDKIIMPLINFLLSLGGENGLESAYSFLKKVTLTDGTVDLASSIYIDWGAFITAIINFLIIALTLFIIIKVAMKSNKLLGSAEGKFKDLLLTKEDLKELKARKISLRDKKAIKAYKQEKADKLLQAKQQQELEAKQKAEEERKNNPTEQDLLKEIRDLLKEKNSN